MGMLMTDINSATQSLNNPSGSQADLKEMEEKEDLKNTVFSICGAECTIWLTFRQHNGTVMQINGP